MRVHGKLYDFVHKVYDCLSPHALPVNENGSHVTGLTHFETCAWARRLSSSFFFHCVPAGILYRLDGCRRPRVEHLFCHATRIPVKMHFNHSFLRYEILTMTSKQTTGAIA